MAAKTFIYANSNIRVGQEPATHRNGSRNLIWYNHSEELWNHINWDKVKQRINENCHGTTEGAKIIETTLNVLDKYTGKKKTRQTVLQQEDGDFGITQELVDQLGSVSMGSSGAAQSLLKYALKDGMDKNTPGFSFENRMSEFIQRLMGNAMKGKKFDIKALETGRESVFVGESVLFYFGDYIKDINLPKKLSESARSKLADKIMEDAKIDFKNLVTYVYENVTRQIDGREKNDIAVVTYKVPQKADITAKNLSQYQIMIIEAAYGKLIGDFLRVINGAKLSLKASTSSSIKLGSTNDNTRLRGFVSEFVENINKDFATICTFIFSSKQSKNVKIQKNLDWARILYELLGTGQRSDLDITKSKNLLVDYLIIDRYKTNGSRGTAIVFNVKDLIANFPVGNYYPPFKITNKDTDENGKNSGNVVELNLGQARNFVFSS